ncbi:KilA-N domain-containing protein [Butyricicoccus sp. AM05-1]|nr:KilA-N domain-containing protein [Butyricicoccus sp. AM05-1]
MGKCCTEKNSVSQDKKQDESYISLTEIARAHSEDAPGYVIQSWLRSGNTLAFLNLWEQENNPDYSEAGYEELLEKKKAASFTLTPKLWIDRTKAIGIVSKQGKARGTFAHPMIACEFASWIAPEFKMLLIKLSLGRTHLK